MCFYVLSPHRERHLNEHQVRLFIAQRIWTVARLFPKMDASSESRLSPRSCVKNQSRRRCYHLSLSAFESQGREAEFHLGIFEVGISCISAHQPTGARLSAARDGANLWDRAGIERALEGQLDPVGCHIWACWRRECWDVALSSSETLALLSPSCLGCSHCGNLE